SVSGAVAKGLHVDIESYVAAISALSQQGIKGQEAGTVLTRIMTAISKSGAEGASMWEALGLAVYDDGNKIMTLSDILRRLEARLDSVSDKERQLILDMLGGT